MPRKINPANPERGSSSPPFTRGKVLRTLGLFRLYLHMDHINKITGNRKHGFALVVTISLMILLTLIAVGLLSLASISLRSSSQGEALATAHANARLSLMIALGELQRAAGPDTRVTARADIRDLPGSAENNPPVLGVWRSWEGSDHETSGTFSGRPVAPDYSSKEPGSSPETRFLAWLTSANVDDPTTLPDTTNGADRVTLVGKTSVGSDPNLQIHLSPTPVSTGGKAGAMAWWVSGENQKAYIPKPEAPVRRGAAERKQAMAQTKSHSTVDPKPFDLESVFSDPDRGTPAADVNRALSLLQADFLGPDPGAWQDRISVKHFHDLTTSSVGLLTNTATGGWKKDMSLLSERWDSLPETGLPLFRLSPDPVEDALRSRATPNAWDRSDSLFYPWTAFLGRNAGFPRKFQPPVVSWSNLIDFVRFYERPEFSNSGGARRVTISDAVTGGGGSTITPLDPTDQSDPRCHAHLNKVRVFPVLARAQFVMSHYAVSTTVGQETKYTPKLVMTPVFTLWNPYDVEMTVSSPYYLDLKMLPITFNYQLESEPANQKYNCLLYTDTFTKPVPDDGRSALDYALENRPTESGAFRTHYMIPAGLNLKPGEALQRRPVRQNRRLRRLQLTARPSTGIYGGGRRARLSGQGHQAQRRNQDGRKYR